VSLGIDYDTAQFAVNAVRLWLDKMGRERYPATGKVTVTANCGGSNGPRLRIKVADAEMATLSLKDDTRR
jgi:hypothetical protein